MRRGLTLTELIVVLALLGIAAAAVGRVGVGQQAHYRDFAGRMRTRATLREGSALLAADLRPISPRAGDLYDGEMRDASIAFRSTVGAFVLCEAAVPGASTIDVMELFAEDGSVAADAATHPAPSAGDSLWLYDSGTDVGGADDGWAPFAMTEVSAVSTCPSGAPAAARDAYRISLSAAVPRATEPHAPVRLFRRVRYTLYAASDGLWYLGFSDCRPLVRHPPCTTLQPIAGPYNAHSAASGGSRSGLLLRYLDREGRETPDAHAVAMIEIVLRARSTGTGRFARDAVERQTVALRNALR